MNFKKQLGKLTDWDKDDLLDLVGLETRRTTTDALIPTLTAFSIGVLVGVGVGLLIAPKPGTELRTDLKNRLGGGSDQLSSAAGTGVSAPRSV